jgi:hypothetical protein
MPDSAHAAVPVRDSLHALSFDAAQAEMRQGHLCGAPGIAVSGFVWLVAGCVALFVGGKAAVITLLVGGMLIFPLGVLLTRLLGRPGTQSPGNPLARLGMEGTLWMLAGIAIAYGLHVLRLEWFFPAMLLIIGGRYLSFQTLYGLRIDWVLGALLCAAGLGLALARAPVAAGALAGAAIELVFSALVFGQARRHTAA